MANRRFDMINSIRRLATGVIDRRIVPFEPFPVVSAIAHLFLRHFDVRSCTVAQID